MSVEKFQTTWWKKVGETPWQETPGGGRTKQSIFRCSETGEDVRADELPCGALYVIERHNNDKPNAWPPSGSDGLAIACVCKFKGGTHHWYIDSRASNCTKPDDKEHRCWVRHGTFGERLTVDKAGNTCGAGAGSFFMGPNNEWHGFLRNGMLTP